MAFRPFFLAAALCGVLAIPLWVAHLTSGLPLAGVSLSWHIHEMILGFAGTTILGFVLTAAQTWTGVRSANGTTLLLLILLWVIARTSWVLGGPMQWIGAISDALLYLMAAAIMWQMVFQSGNWRNVFFVPVFLAFASFSTLHAYAIYTGNFELARAMQDFAFYLVVHVILVVGGRVIPFFSDRKLQRTETIRYRWLELGALSSSLVFIAVIVLSREASLLRLAAAGVACLNLLRWLSWRPWQAAGTPLLWSLYIAYGFIVAGFTGMALGLDFSTTTHLIAIGGMALMILSMISRVSLGHTGRPLEVPGYYSFAFLCLITAALTRALANFMPEYYFGLLWLAAGAWTLGFLLFLYHFTPFLTQPRPDGKPG